MTRYLRTALGTIATLAIAAAATAAIAHSGGMGGDMQGGMEGGNHGAMHGRMHGAMGGAMHGAMGEGRGPGMDGMQHGGPGQQLMTPEERQAMRDKMRNAKSPQERQALAAANRAEMEKRAKEKGIALPEHRNGAGGMGGGHQH